MVNPRSHDWHLKVTDTLLVNSVIVVALSYRIIALFFPQFSEFDTERNFDTVQILGGGRTEDTAVNIATLSGHGDEYTAKTFTSASNFMVIKFRSDGSVEKRGFRASWRTEAQSCGGDLVATAAPQVLSVK